MDGARTTCATSTVSRGTRGGRAAAQTVLVPCNFTDRSSP
jgi:hypothetical protein